MAAEALEQSVLESKDKDQLLAIAKALGLKANSRTKKAEIIDSILEMTGSAAPIPATNGDSAAAVDEQPHAEGLNGSAVSNGGDAALPARPVPPPQPSGGDSVDAIGENAPVLGEDGEPLAEWELAIGSTTEVETVTAPATDGSPAPSEELSSGVAVVPTPPGQLQPAPADGESRNRRRRRRRKGNRGDGPQGDDAGLVEADLESQPVVAANEPVEVSGYIDMRDEGYGFLRVKGYLPSREDSYIPVKLARQYGLRKGDHITGTSRPAGRNEKNPALLDVLTVNGADPEQARRRPRFEDLTALFPDKNLHLEDPAIRPT